MSPADVVAPRPVTGRTLLHEGMVWDVVGDTVDLGAAGTVRREYVRHPGAVAVLAIDAEDRILLLKQYRHPVGRELWEPPAGLLDVPEEELVCAAARELAEEADLVAGSWWHLLDYFTSPGGSDERLRLYVARDLTSVPEADRHVREAEEQGIVLTWVPLDDAVAAVLGGRLGNPSTVVGVLGLAAARERGWTDLVPVPIPQGR